MNDLSGKKYSFFQTYFIKELLFFIRVYQQTHDYHTVGGTQSAINASTYSVTFTLKDTANYSWDSGDTEAKIIYLTIHKDKIPKSAITSTFFTYTEETITLAENLPSVIKVSGSNSAKAVGAYSVTYKIIYATRGYSTSLCYE